MTPCNGLSSHRVAPSLWRNAPTMPMRASREPLLHAMAPCNGLSSQRVAPLFLAQRPDHARASLPRAPAPRSGASLPRAPAPRSGRQVRRLHRGIAFTQTTRPVGSIGLRLKGHAISIVPKSHRPPFEWSTRQSRASSSSTISVRASRERLLHAMVRASREPLLHAMAPCNGLPSHRVAPSFWRNAPTMPVRASRERLPHASGCSTQWSTTAFDRFRGRSTSTPCSSAMKYANICSGTTSSNRQQVLRRRLHAHAVAHQPCNLRIARVGKRNHLRALLLHVAQQLQCLLVAQH